METMDCTSSPNKRLKTETVALDPRIMPSSGKGKASISEDDGGHQSPAKTLTLDPQISPSSTKGKAPILDDDEENDFEPPVELSPQNCGICFQEEGKTVRGLIDSCDHYFCFLCIVEWSKVESRCPLCRARFSNIRRMRKDGSFIGDGSVRVPVRDQIYDPFGEPADPYAQVKCTVCSSTTDESLLLLCDLCDSAWHTYCVGLGVTVPEGDWYCRDCSLLRAEQCDGEMDDNVDSSINTKAADGAPSTSDPVSIFDIVRDPMEPESGIDRLLKLVSPPAKKFSPLTIASDRANVASAGNSRGARSSLRYPVDATELSTRSNLKSPIDATESSARTLRNCRNVHRHITVLRENWDAFRKGSLSFSSNLLDSSGKSSRKANGTAKRAETSSELQSSLLNASTLHSTAPTTSCSMGSNKESYNLEKAWKLMNIARQQVAKLKGVPKIGLSKARGLKVDNVRSSHVMTGVRDIKSSRLGIQKPSDKTSGMVTQGSGKHQFTSIVDKAASTSGSKFPNRYPSRLSLPGKTQTPVEADVHDKRVVSWIKGGRQSTLVDNGTACSASSCVPVAGAVSYSKSITKEPSICPGKQAADVNAGISSQAEVRASFQADVYHDTAGCPTELNLDEMSSALEERKVSTRSTFPCRHSTGVAKATCNKLWEDEKLERPSAGIKIARKLSKNDEAKDEIQSLVKLNLKLLSKNKKLGADVFKEIARVSTHTILAACGFEHRKIIHSYPKSVCCHGEHIQQLHRSTLMPSSCTECFYLFVKNVVNSIMSEKLNSAGVAD